MLALGKKKKIPKGVSCELGLEKEIHLKEKQVGRGMRLCTHRPEKA